MIKKPVILVDGSSYLFRAFHALPPLITSKGQPTGAVYGVVNMLKKLIKTYEPEWMAVVFDPKGKTLRHTVYAEYKAHRPAMPEELASQIAPLHAIIQAMGLPLLIIPGVEADDVIGTLAAQAEEKKLPVLISTGDKDFAQMVNPHVTLINTMSNEMLDREGVIAKFGVTPEQIPDYLALMGDAVDNVPGVPKVGPKTALKWLQLYGSLENIMEHAADITGKVGENLRSVLGQLPLSKQLVTIHKNIPLPLDLTTVKREAPDVERLRTLFTELEFKLDFNGAALPKTAPASSPRAAIQDHALLATPVSWKEWAAKIEKATVFSFDIQTDKEDAMQAALLGFSMAVDGHAIYVPCAGEDLKELKKYLQDPHKTVVSHHLKYIYKVMRRHGIEIHATLFDTLLAAYVLDSTQSRHDLRALSQKYLQEELPEDIEITAADTDKIAVRASETATLILRLHQSLLIELQKIPTLLRVLREIELPLVPILANMEFQGVLVDVNLLHVQSQELEKKLKVLSENVYHLAGEVFNLDSPKQLRHILFEKLGLPTGKKTMGGEASTSEAVLSSLAEDYPLPRLLLEYRGLNKLKTTYTDKLPLQVNPQTGRIHTSYAQAVTSTGRLACKDPNLQNIPVRTEEGRRIRQAFIAPPGTVIVAADYSQVELRIMAHLSQDPGLIQAFQQGLDIHTATAAEVMKVPFAKVTAEQRRHAKVINFGLIYGMSVFGLAQQLGVESRAAQAYMDLYFSRYPNVHGYMEATRKQAHSQGYVETLFGRRLYVPDIHSNNKMQQKAAERAAINGPLQGTAADIIKRAMIAFDLACPQTTAVHCVARMIMQVHDELVFEVPENDLETSKHQIKQAMESAAMMTVPLVVAIGVGRNWEEAH